jgi:hypothetical protein
MQQTRLRRRRVTLVPFALYRHLRCDAEPYRVSAGLLPYDDLAPLANTRGPMAIGSRSGTASPRP